MDSYRSQYSPPLSVSESTKIMASPKSITNHPSPISSILSPQSPADSKNGTLPKKPRTFAQWVAAAKENTREIKLHGSLAPLVWVLVEGKDIPPNALIGGEDRRKPLYIARSFYEGGVYIGKAGRHLKLGAAIPYNGREVEVSTYEVLVPALHPIRYAISETLEFPEIPRMAYVHEQNVEGLEHLSLTQGKLPNAKNLHRLSSIKTVILIDDSASMAGALWAEAREALAGVADVNAKFSTSGVDLYFLNNTRLGLDMKDGNEIRKLFDSVVPDGQTPTGEKLQQIFDKYIPLVEDKRLEHKPITIVVITDGVPTDDPQSVIVQAARRLDQSEVPVYKIGVQFAQIGDDEDATDALRELDDGLSDVFGIRDMVDTTLYNASDEHFTTATMIKILLGAISDQTTNGHQQTPLIGL